MISWHGSGGIGGFRRYEESCLRGWRSSEKTSI